MDPGIRFYCDLARFPSQRFGDMSSVAVFRNHHLDKGPNVLDFS